MEKRKGWWILGQTKRKKNWLHLTFMLIEKRKKKTNFLRITSIILSEVKKKNQNEKKNSKDFVIKLKETNLQSLFLQKIITFFLINFFL